MKMGFASVQKENIDLVAHEVVCGLKIVYAVGAGNTMFSFFLPKFCLPSSEHYARLAFYPSCWLLMMLNKA